MPPDLTALHRRTVLCAGAALVAKPATYASTANTLTQSYARPLTDFLDETLHVVSFIPEGTAERAVADWGPIWNTALTEARAVVARGRTFELVGPECEQTFLTQVNGTDIVSFGSVVDFRSALFVCATTGLTTLDFTGAWFMTFRGLRLQGGIGGSGANIENVPLVGFAWGRAVPDSNADTNTFEGVWTNGAFGLTALYCLAAESNSINRGWISNNVAPAQMLGVVSVCGTPTPGAANVAYALICDALAHWKVPNLYPGGRQWPEETASTARYVSFEQFVCRGVTFTCGSGPALWISSGTNHDFDDGYLNSGSPDALIDWYRRDDDAPQRFIFKLHCESANGGGYKTLIRFLGNMDRGACYCDGLEFVDGATVFCVNFASQEMTHTPKAVLSFTNMNVLIGKATSGTGGAPSGGLWNNPALFKTHGELSIPTAIWNGCSDSGAGYGHTGELNLYNPDGSVTAAIVGQIQIEAPLALSSVNEALSGLGIAVTTDSVQSVTMTDPGHLYSGTGAKTAYTPTVTFPTPPSGAVATGTCLLQINGMGVANGAKGTGYPSGTTVGLRCVDADGLALPWLVTIVGDGRGGIAAVYSDRLVKPLILVPSGPYLVIQKGASGGQIYADIGVASVRMTRGGSGYQNFKQIVAPMFSPAGPTGNANLIGAISVGSTRVVPVLTAVLPKATEALEGTFAAVTDAKSDTSGATAVGGGSCHVPVYCNGTTWIVR